MKRIALTIVFAGLLFQAACSRQKPGLVMMTDESYRPRIIATSKTGFGSPDGLVWRKGDLYIADEGGQSLACLSQTGALRTLADTKLGVSSPEDLVIDADGNIFFTDDDAGGVWTVDPTGNARLLAGKDKGLISTEGIAFAPDGSLLVGDGEQHAIFRVTRDGKVSEFLSSRYGIGKPESMVFDDRGNVYIADNQDDVLYLLDPGHELHRIIEHRESFSPETLFFSQGTLYITDSHHGKLFVYRPHEELRTIAAFAGELQNIHGVTTDDAGNIFVSIQTDLKRKRGDIIELSKERS